MVNGYIEKSLMALMLAVIMFFTTTVPVAVSAFTDQVLVPVRLSMYSNLSDRHYINGYYRDGVFYVSLADLADISGADVDRSDRYRPELALNRGARRFVLHVSSNVMVEHFYSDYFNIKMPMMLHNGEIYVSALDFLHYIGADIRLDEHATVQFMVAVRYNFFDALADFGYSGWGHFFIWSEIGYTSGNLERTLTLAGLNALLNRESNFFIMAISPQSIVQSAMEDTLMDILTIASAPHLMQAGGSVDFLNITNRFAGIVADVTGVADDVLGFAFDILSDGEGGLAWEVTGDVFDAVSHYAEVFGVSAMLLGNAVNAIESARAFERITANQRDLLDIILRGYRHSSIIMDATGNDRRYMETVLDAAQNIHRQTGSAYLREITAIENALRRTAIDLATSAVTLKNPVATAWDYAWRINRWHPFSASRLERDIQLHNAYNASLIQQVAAELVVHYWSRLFYTNYLPIANQYTLQQQTRRRQPEQSPKVDGEWLQIMYMYDMRDAMVLQLKSAITIRESLINSGVLTGAEAARARHLNQENAALLHNIINANIIGVREAAIGDHNFDVSWMAGFVMPPVVFDASEAMAAYYEFLTTRAFEPYIEPGLADWDAELLSPLRYAILDISGGGVPQLIITTTLSHREDASWIFTYEPENGKIVFITFIFGINPRHSQSRGAIVFTHVGGINVQEFFTVDDLAANSFGSFELISFQGNFYRFYGGVEESISQQEFLSYVDELVEIGFSQLPDRVRIMDITGNINPWDFIGLPRDTIVGRRGEPEEEGWLRIGSGLRWYYMEYGRIVLYWHYGQPVSWVYTTDRSLTINGISLDNDVNALASLFGGYVCQTRGRSGGIRHGDLVLFFDVWVAGNAVPSLVRITYMDESRCICGY
ncbi:MAG: hypothetical protein FWC95_00735 [Defluviitaleaceae bacterium]|nr:hypothetical protein [Defluviitaleaceae bacterium]